MSRCTKHVLNKDVCHANQPLPWIAWRRGMSFKWGCINTYLRNLICSTHSLACKTFSHPMAWWIYPQVDLQCLHSQCKCPLFVGDLLWNDGGHQYALFLNVAPGCWWALRHSHCHIAMALAWIWFQSVTPQNFPLLKIGLKWFVYEFCAHDNVGNKTFC